MRFARFVRVSLLSAAPVVLAGNVAAAQRTGACKGQFDCFEVTTFVANVTDFRVSGTDSRVATATVRFLNKAGHPLILGYVQGSGIVTDDQGNRYLANGQNAVRGIGEISSNAIDSKFSLEANEASDTRFEFSWRPPRNQILGTTYEMELTVREINSLPGNQFRLGKEYALTFKGFGATKATAAATAGAAPAAAAPSAAAPAAAATPAVDPCGTTPRCYSAGKFVATITQVSSSSQKGSPANRHTVRLTMKIKNVGSQPIILGYRAESEQLVDEDGNRYDNERRLPNGVRGIGIIDNRNADPQFSLVPGEARDAMFESQLGLDNSKSPGTVFSYDLTLEELEILPSKQVRSTRTYAVGFHDIKQSSSDKGKSLLDALKPTITIKKP